MKRKDFANVVLDKIGWPENVRSLDHDICIYSDKHEDGTKVLRIKAHTNISGHTYRECEEVLEELLLKYPNIESVVVRNATFVTWSGLNFVIQINYTGELPDITVKPVAVVESPHNVEGQKPSETNFKITELPGGMFKVETPFGVGFATDKVDLNKMLLWLEGFSIGKSLNTNNFIVEEEEPTDPKEDFRQALEDIIADTPLVWWQIAEDTMEEYREFFTDNAEMTDIAMDVFRNNM